MIDLAGPIVQQLRDKIIANKQHTHEGIQAEKIRRMAERPGTTELTPEEATLTEKYRAMDREMAELPKLLSQDDYESMPQRLREFIDWSISLSPADRKTIYEDRSEELRDIEQYARERTFRRSDVETRLL